MTWWSGRALCAASREGAGHYNIDELDGSRMKDGLSHCPHSIEVALMGDAAGDAIKTRWQRVRQAIGSGDAARVSTMEVYPSG